MYTEFCASECSEGGYERRCIFNVCQSWWSCKLPYQLNKRSCAFICRCPFEEYRISRLIKKKYILQAVSTIALITCKKIIQTFMCPTINLYPVYSSDVRPAWGGCSSFQLQQLATHKLHFSLNSLLQGPWWVGREYRVCTSHVVKNNVEKMTIQDHLLSALPYATLRS